MRSRLTLLGVAAATLAVAACAHDELMNPLPPDGTEAVAVDLATIVTTVDREDGSAVVILDMGGGELGIVERESVDPRFTGPSAGGKSPLADPGYDIYACDSFGTEWVADWKAAFVGITKYREALYPHNYSPPLTFYPGAPVYYGTNTNSITYLGACNGDSHDDLIMEVHRRISGTWTKIYEATIGSYEKYTFYSGIPAAYRGLTYGADGSVIEHYGIGAAWTLSPSEATP
jgi:hypothetical protein